MQLEEEENERQKKKIIFMQKQREDYNNYMKMKEQQKQILNNDRMQTPIKITKDKDYRYQRKNIDSLNDNLCTYIGNDNCYARAGFKVKPLKIPEKFANNQINEYANRNFRKDYNIINFEPYNKCDINQKQGNNQMMNKENFYQQKQQINYNNSNNQEQHNMSQRDLSSQEYLNQ